MVGVFACGRNGPSRKVDAVALQRLLEDSGATYKTNKRSYVFSCPRCAKKDKLMMFRADGRFICWVCAETSGFKGRAEFALTEILGMPVGHIQEKIYGDSFADTPADFFSITLRDFFEDEPVPDDLVQQQRGIQYPLDFYPVDHQFGRRGLEYLQGRGIDAETARFYDLRYCPVQRRVIFPIKVGEKLLGWQARATFETEWEDEDGSRKSAPKILTTGKRDTALMFQDRLAGSPHAIITEGPVDGIKCHLVGGNVTTMGKVVSEQQIRIIKNCGVKKIYLAQDPDAATETMRLCRAFGDFTLYRLLPAEGYGDLGAMSFEAVREQFLRAPRIYPNQLFLSLGT